MCVWGGGGEFVCVCVGGGGGGRESTNAAIFYTQDTLSPSLL